MVTGILTWHNETGRTSYPLAKNNAVFNDLIVDANFVQFDNAIPVLNTVLVSATDLSITIAFDIVTITVSFLRSTYNSGVRNVSFYDNANGYNKRFLGRLVIGNGANTLWNNYSNQLLTFNVPFLASTVRSIPSTDALYSVEGRFGDIVFSHDAADDAIFYNTSSDWICFNAVQNSRFPAVSPAPALKQINLVKPVNNNIFLSYNDVIQITNTAANVLNISLVTTDFSPSTVVPTLS